ncbi:MAG: phosphatidylglycerophosphatase A [Thermodesulfovibrionales bacterium]
MPPLREGLPVLSISLLVYYLTMMKEEGPIKRKNPVSSGSLISALLKNVATLGFIGYLPVAPGTWGTAAGLIFVACIPLSQAAFLVFIASGILIGTIAAGTAERLIGETDSGHIIIDEFVGFLVSVLFIPHTYGYLASAFLLFRFFDILKPFPIGRIEKEIKGGAGIIADDIIAGIFTNVVLQIWKMSF